jgi:hypothetical protein
VAQSKLKATAIGQEPNAFTAASDATSISTDQVWAIFASGISRDDAAKILADMRLRVLDGKTTWPIA